MPEAGRAPSREPAASQQRGPDAAHRATYCAARLAPVVIALATLPLWGPVGLLIEPPGDGSSWSSRSRSFECYPRGNFAAIANDQARHFGRVTHIKLVARLKPGMRSPEELPETLELPLPTFTKFLRKRSMREEARLLAEALGFDFMDVR